MIGRGGDDTVDVAGARGGGRGGGEGRYMGPDKAPTEDRGGTLEERGEGQSPRAVGGRARPSFFFNSDTYAERREGDRHRSTVSKHPYCVEACRAAAASTLTPTITALSSMFRDVLRLL